MSKQKVTLTAKQYHNMIRMYQALRTIARDYMAAEKIKGDQYGLSDHEALEMSYDNMQQEAKKALKGITPKSLGIAIVKTKTV